MLTCKMIIEDSSSSSSDEEKPTKKSRGGRRRSPRRSSPVPKSKYVEPDEDEFDVHQLIQIRLTYNSLRCRLPIVTRLMNHLKMLEN
jgi:hypothetical protein